MEDENNGVVPTEDAEAKVLEEIGGQHSKEDQGTDEDAVVTLDEDKGGEDVKVNADPKDSRINNLMSKWQSEESSHKHTKSELELYKEKFGDIDTEQKVIDEDDLPETFKPDWKPQTTEDIQKGMREAAEYGARKALGTLEKTSKARQEAETAVDNFIGEVKEVDSEFNEKEFYGYANKHHFPLKNVQDLRSVYSSYHEMQVALANAGKTAIKNKEKRNDVVHKPGNGDGGNKGGADYNKIRNSHSAQDLVHDHFNQ